MKSRGLALSACVASSACAVPPRSQSPETVPMAARAEAPAANVLVVPGASVASPTPQAPTVPSPSPPPPPADPVPSLHVDCTSRSEDHAGESLRGWHMGGPAGGSFNWQGSAIACTVEADARCSGSGRIRLAMGSKPFADRPFTASVEKPTLVTIDIPAKQWERALEHDGTFEYERLQVVARLDVYCVDEGAPAGTVHLVDGFVGGFGGGE